MKGPVVGQSTKHVAFFIHMYDYENRHIKHHKFHIIYIIISRIHRSIAGLSCFGFLVFPNTKDFCGKTAGIQGQVAAMESQPKPRSSANFQSSTTSLSIHRGCFGSICGTTLQGGSEVFDEVEGGMLVQHGLLVEFIGFFRTAPKREKKTMKMVPSWELTYPKTKALLKMIFLFPKWDMFVPWRVQTTKG